MLAGCSNEGPQKPAEQSEPAHASRDGGALFRQYCASCHPDGGNVSDPERTLYRSVLKKNHITTSEDIVRVIRQPLSRMIRFDASMLSDSDARAIAEYILKTFK
jgi:cytochrome c6